MNIGHERSVVIDYAMYIICGGIEILHITCVHKPSAKEFPSTKGLFAASLPHLVIA